NPNYPIVWLDRKGKTPLLPAPGLYFSPRLSPDGKRLALSVGSGLNDIWIYEWARDSMTRLTFTGQSNSWPVWTPDGKHIAFSSQAAPGYTIWWNRADRPGEAQPLLESKNPIYPASFSPDARQLAFVE